MVKEINAGNFEEEVLKSTEPVVVDMYADWCGPCKMMAPVVDELSREYGRRQVLQAERGSGADGGRSVQSDVHSHLPVLQKRRSGRHRSGRQRA